MKFFKIKALIVLAALSFVMFQSCDESTSPTTEGPVISTITPLGAFAGDVITITGSNFGSENDQGSVYFGSIQAEGTVGASGSDYVSWSDTKIEVKIPAGVPGGNVQIKVYNGSSEKTSLIYDYVVGIPPTNLKATSENASSVLLQWDNVASATGYMVYVYEGNTQKMVTPNPITDNPYEITGLTEGTIYTFKVSAMKGNSESAQSDGLMWAPASRFGEATPFKLYEKASTSGSGLDLYDGSNGPKVLTVSDKTSWNVAINTDGGLFFQTGSAITLGSTSISAQETQASDVYFDNTNTLDNVFDNQALDAGNFAPRSFDLNDNSLFNSASGVVFIVRTMEPGQSEYNYAKVLVKRGADGNFLQGSSPNQYVDCVVSYQITPGVPYARKAH